MPKPFEHLIDRLVRGHGRRLHLSGSRRERKQRSGSGDRQARQAAKDRRRARGDGHRASKDARTSGRSVESGHEGTDSRDHRSGQDEDTKRFERGRDVLDAVDEAADDTLHAPCPFDELEQAVGGAF